MLKFAVSVDRIFRPDSVYPLQTYSPKCQKEAFCEVGKRGCLGSPVSR
jgi:hypothetical protein